MSNGIAMNHREGYLHANRGYRGRGEADAQGERALPADVGLTPEQRFLFVSGPTRTFALPQPPARPAPTSAAVSHDHPLSSNIAR